MIKYHQKNRTKSTSIHKRWGQQVRTSNVCGWKSTVKSCTASKSSFYHNLVIDVSSYEELYIKSASNKGIISLSDPIPKESTFVRNK